MPRGTGPHATSAARATEKLPHTFEWVVDKKPSATVDGSKHEQCSACGFAKDPVSIPATGGTVDPEQGGEGSDQGGPSANDQDASSAEQGKKGPGLAKTDDASQGAIGSSHCSPLRLRRQSPLRVVLP